MHLRALAYAMVAVALAAGVPPAVAQQTAALPPGRVVFPTDELTVADPAQATGRRMALPLPADCDAQQAWCDDTALLNTLDGFDLDPRIVVELDANPVADDLEAALQDVLVVEPEAGGDPIPVDRVVLDPATSTLYAHPATQLIEGTRYRAVYRGEGTTFTTLSATAGLASMRAQLDDGSAYAAAGIADDERGLSFTIGELRPVFPAATVVQITRRNEVVPGGPLVDEMVLNSAVAGAGTYAFGSYLSPSWLRPDSTIAPTPTGGAGPEVVGVERVGVTVVLPAGAPPEGGWPVAIFGPGITRSKYDVFLASDLNASRGLATMSFDPVGHAYGPRSEVAVQTLAAPDGVVFPSFGRGLDRNDDGVIINSEGVQTPVQPDPSASIALRDGLRQTAADVMALVRAIAADADIDGDGTRDLDPEGVRFFAQSLGGIYGTMLMATDPQLRVAVLNVPGGPIVDIARQSPGFRTAVQASLRDRVPALLNGGLTGFTESLPLRLDPAVTGPAPGSIAIQDALARVNWINRPGSPEAFAPRIRTAPLDGGEPKDVVYQFAFGDQTVPNPTSATLARAFGEPERVAVYRNDQTATASTNPHGFLLDPRLQGREQGQAQVSEFLATTGASFVDPDGPAPTWETPIADVDELETLNFPTDLFGEPLPAPRRQVERASGPDRIATAAAVSAATFETAETVLVARADAYADALAGAPLAGALAAPLLLTGRDALAEATLTEISRLGASSAVLLGGESALAPAVADALVEAGVEVRRVAGPNRFATAAAVAAEVGYSSEVLLVQGSDPDPRRGWPDALSAAALGSGLRQPILLTTADALPPETRDALSPSADVTVIGGRAAVSDAVLADIDAAAATVTRLAGPDRYATSAAVATAAFQRGLSATVTWLASGRDFADGLAAGAAAGATRGILLLVDGADASGAPAVLDFLGDHAGSVDRLVLAGGAAAIRENVQAAATAAIGGGPAAPAR